MATPEEVKEFQKKYGDHNHWSEDTPFLYVYLAHDLVVQVDLEDYEPCNFMDAIAETLFKAGNTLGRNSLRYELHPLLRDEVNKDVITG